MRRTLTGKQSFKGRGALSNPPGASTGSSSLPVDDGWYLEDEPESIATTLEPERAREIITTTIRRIFRSSNPSIHTGDANTVCVLQLGWDGDSHGRRLDARTGEVAGGRLDLRD